MAVTAIKKAIECRLRVAWHRPGARLFPVFAIAVVTAMPILHWRLFVADSQELMPHFFILMPTIALAILTYAVICYWFRPEQFVFVLLSFPISIAALDVAVIAHASESLWGPVSFTGAYCVALIRYEKHGAATNEVGEFQESTWVRSELPLALYALFLCAWVWYIGAMETISGKLYIALLIGLGASTIRHARSF